MNAADRIRALKADARFTSTAKGFSACQELDVLLRNAAMEIADLIQAATVVSDSEPMVLRAERQELKAAVAAVEAKLATETA